MEVSEQNMKPTDILKNLIPLAPESDHDSIRKLIFRMSKSKKYIFRYSKKKNLVFVRLVGSAKTSENGHRWSTIFRIFWTWQFYPLRGLSSTVVTKNKTKRVLHNTTNRQVISYLKTKNVVWFKRNEGDSFFMSDAWCRLMGEATALAYRKPGTEKYRIVTGTELRTVYSQIHSCMSKNIKNKLYAENPERARLFVRYEKGEPVARAILWTTDDGITILERCYMGGEAHTPRGREIRAEMKAEAVKRGWWVRERGNLPHELKFSAVTLRRPKRWPLTANPYTDHMTIGVCDKDKRIFQLRSMMPNATGKEFVLQAPVSQGNLPYTKQQICKCGRTMRASGQYSTNPSPPCLHCKNKITTTDEGFQSENGVMVCQATGLVYSDDKDLVKLADGKFIHKLFTMRVGSTIVTRKELYAKANHDKKTFGSEAELKEYAEQVYGNKTD